MHRCWPPSIQVFDSSHTTDQALLVGNSLASMCPRLQCIECVATFAEACASFLSCLATCVHLSCASVHLLLVETSSDIVAQLSRFTSLRRLRVGGPYVSTLGVAPLASLKQLQVLAVQSYCVQGLQALLPTCPLLSSLMLECREVAPAGGPPLRSPFLQELWLGSHDFTNRAGSALACPTVLACRLDLAQLPSLRRVCMRGLRLVGCHADVVHRLAVVMAEWPVEPLGGEFVLDGPPYALLPETDSLALVQALAPLQNAAWPKRVHKLWVKWSPSGADAVHMLSSAIFPAAWVSVDGRRWA